MVALTLDLKFLNIFICLNRERNVLPFSSVPRLDRGRRRPQPAEANTLFSATLTRDGQIAGLPAPSHPKQPTDLNWRNLLRRINVKTAFSTPTEENSSYRVACWARRPNCSSSNSRSKRRSITEDAKLTLPKVRKNPTAKLPPLHYILPLLLQFLLLLLR